MKKFANFAAVLTGLALWLIVFAPGTTLAGSDQTSAYVNKEQLAQKKRVMRAFARDLARADELRQVLKTPYFWYYFSDPERLEAVFNGRFEYQALIDKKYLLELMSFYLYDKWSSCRSALKGEVRYFEITTTRTTRSYGRVSDVDVSKKIVGIEPRFAEHFERNFYSGVPIDDLARAVLELGAVQDISKIPQQFFKGTLGKYVNPTFDGPKVIRLFGCEGAGVEQFEQNLLRAIEGRKSLQREGAAIEGAVEASDRAFLEGNFGSIGEACYFDKLFMGGNMSSSSLQYCRCVESELMASLGPDEVVKFTLEYENFKHTDRHEASTVNCRRGD